MDEASRQNVLAFLARDVELISTVAGDIRRVNAIGPDATDSSFASLQAQITTDGPASLRWSVGSRSAHGSALEATLVGEQGTITLHARESATNDFPAWQLTTTTDGQRQEQLLDPYNAPQTAIEQLAAAVAETSADRRSAASTWGAATRAMEVVDAVNLSLEKGRTIDVFQQQLTEQLAFRGAMAAIGCGLLIVGFAVIVLVTMLGGAEGAAGRRRSAFLADRAAGCAGIFPDVASRAIARDRNRNGVAKRSPRRTDRTARSAQSLPTK